jgi:hypothetical protein
MPIKNKTMNVQPNAAKFTTFEIGLAIISFSLVSILLNINSILYETFLISSAYGDEVCCKWTPDQDYKDGYFQGCADGQEDNEANLDANYHYDVSGISSWNTGYTAGYYEGYEIYNCVPAWDE